MVVYDNVVLKQYPSTSRIFGTTKGTQLSKARLFETLSVQGISTANVYVCTYVGGGSVVGGRAVSASTNSWESQSTPVSLGRVQRVQNIIQSLHYFIGFHFSVDLPIIITSALLRVCRSIILILEAQRNVPTFAFHTDNILIYVYLVTNAIKKQMLKNILMTIL